MYQNNLQELKEAARIADSNLKVLLNNPEGLNTLIDFLRITVQIMSDDYTQAAKKSVFAPDVRVDAIRKYGLMGGVDLILQRMNQLRELGR